MQTTLPTEIKQMLSLGFANPATINSIPEEVTNTDNSVKTIYENSNKAFICKRCLARSQV